MTKYRFTRKITLNELLLGIFGGFLSFVLIAFFNISNEDIYNWDLTLIFAEGGVLDIIAFLAFWLWLGVMLMWMISLIYRIFAYFSPRKKAED